MLFDFEGNYMIYIYFILSYSDAAEIEVVHAMPEQQ